MRRFLLLTIALGVSGTGVPGTQQLVAAEAVGMSILVDDEDVAGFTITYDGESEAELWMMLKETPLTFERDFHIPVDPDASYKATLTGNIELHAKRRGTPGSRATVEKLRLILKGPGHWVVASKDVERTLKAAGLAVPEPGPSPRAMANGISSVLMLIFVAILIGAGWMLFRPKPAVDN